MDTKITLSRREFLKVSAAAGTGLLISIYLSGCEDSPTATPEPTESATVAPEPTAIPEPTITSEPTVQLEPNAFLRIVSTGAVTIILHKCELGQGVGTTLPMIVAEELDADWSKVSVEQVRVDDIVGKPRTSGSDSTQDLYQPLRWAGAAARTMLVAAAAQTWDVEPETCYTENGAVIHQPTDQRLTYGELVETAATLSVPRGGNVVLKDPKDFRLIGTSVPRFENTKIVDGSAVYGIDVHIPGMLCAAVARCPVFDGSVAEADASQVGAVPGIQRVVQINSGVAVVADSTWAALQGRRALQVAWNEERNADLSSESIRQSLAERVSPPDDTNDANRLEAIYEMPFLAHVTPEPMNCVADVREDSCEVWAPTQNLEDTKLRTVMLTGLSRDAVRVHVPMIGGGFGRRLETDYVEEAVRISKAISAPVKVTWTREDDMQHDFYHPYSYHHISANLDEPNRLTMRSHESRDIPTGAWRAATNIAPAFVEECFMDEVATALNRDPYELRMELPRYQQLYATLELAATKAEWGTPLPDGWGRGIACWSTWDVTPTAVVLEVSIDDDRTVRVHRAVGAIECGIVINPDIVKAQVEGGIVMGLTAALKGEITLKNGRVQQSNFYDYPLLRFDEMPTIEVYIVPSDRDPSGVGEMGVPPTPPALLNAVFAATGKRIRKLPVRPEDLRQA
jgi:isoquinoline 1-oxidoreductase beta subunit